MKSKFLRFSPEWWAWMTVPEPNSGCLLWLGCVCKHGYGRLSSNGSGGKLLAHRAAYECAYGPIADKRHVCHRCDTPSCVNPDHLFVGTQEDNMRDMFAKGRARPRGTGTPQLQLLRTLTAPLTASSLASENSNASVRIVEEVHPIRTTAVVARWRQVTGVPAKRPTQAVVLYSRPRERTPEPSSSTDEGYQAVATVAACCALAACQGG